MYIKTFELFNNYENREITSKECKERKQETVEMSQVEFTSFYDLYKDRYSPKSTHIDKLYGFHTDNSCFCHGFVMKRHNGSRYIYDSDFSEEIIKIKDDWYLYTIYNRNDGKGEYKYFLCDTIDGLKKMMGHLITSL